MNDGLVEKAPQPNPRGQWLAVAELQEPETWGRGVVGGTPWDPGRPLGARSPARTQRRVLRRGVKILK